MTEANELGSALEIAYYYPEPYWHSDDADGLKTLLLFFDEIATLLPRYMRGREVAADPVLATPLAQAGLLRILEPETFIDQQLTEDLSTALVDLITAGVFDGLNHDTYYAELSQSRLGWDADVGLAGMVIDELQQRGLAKPSQDGVSVPLHPVVRTTVLVLLAQLARSAGRRQGMNLHPTTARPAPVHALMNTMAREPLPSAAHVVALDLHAVTVNLASVPLDEILGFRKEHGQSYRAYARDLRHLLLELGPMDATEREDLLNDREEALFDQAQDLRRAARKAWKLPFASFSLGVAGAAWALTGQHDIMGAALALGSGVVGALATGQPTACAYSYLFEAQRTLAMR